MMQRHPSVVPFLVHISNDAKHMERFAVRSKVMTLRADGEGEEGGRLYICWRAPSWGASLRQLSARCLHPHCCFKGTAT